MIDYDNQGRQPPEAEGKICVTFDTEAEGAQLLVLLRAAKVYSERNERYKDNWTRMGWRGVLVRIRERSERLWDDWWSSPVKVGHHDWNADDAIDLINFAAFFVRAIAGATTRDGSWWDGV